MKWEFQSMTLGQLRSATVIENLNILGSKGWELVSVDGRIAYFKRAISEQESSYFTPEYFDKINEMAMKQFAQAIVEVPTKQSYDD